MITYQKVLRGRRYWSPANMFRWIPSYSIVEIHVREELTKVLKANKLRVAWDAREASCARVERKLEQARRARAAAPRARRARAAARAAAAPRRAAV